MGIFKTIENKDNSHFIKKKLALLHLTEHIVKQYIFDFVD